MRKTNIIKIIKKRGKKVVNTGYNEGTAGACKGEKCLLCVIIQGGKHNMKTTAVVVVVSADISISPACNFS